MKIVFTYTITYEKISDDTDLTVFTGKARQTCAIVSIQVVMTMSTILARSACTFIYILITKCTCPTRIAKTSKVIEEIKAHGTILARTRPTFIDLNLTAHTC